MERTLQQIEFDRSIQNVLAQADEKGLLIYCGWTVLIARAKAVEYVKTYNAAPNIGFYEHDGKVVLTHNDGRITFSAQEGDAIVQLIRAAYPEA